MLRESLHMPSPHDIGELYLQHHGWVVSLLRRKLGNRDQALDMAQDTFVRLLRSEMPSLLREPAMHSAFSKTSTGTGLPEQPGTDGTTASA